MSASENPYSSPSETSTLTNRQIAMRRLRPPAICLLVCALLTLGMYSLNLLGIALMYARQMNELADSQLGFWAAYWHVYTLSMLVSAIVIYSAIQMLRVRQYPACTAGALLAAIPFCSPCYVLGIPFAIWAMVVLSSKETRAAFAEAK